MNKQFTFLTIFSAFFLILCTTFLSAQNLSKRTRFDSERISVFHSKVDSFLNQENFRDNNSLLSNEAISDDCVNSKCKTFILSFSSASNSVLIPDMVVFINKVTGKPYGGLDSRDFVKGIHTRFLLPIGEYTMIAKHYMYDDFYQNIIVNSENLNEIEYLQNTGMGLNSKFEPINVPVYDPKGMHILGQVKDLQTGLPLSGVKVSVAEFYPNYKGDPDISAISDKYGYFYSDKVIPFAVNKNNTITIKGYSGEKAIVRVLLKYEYPGYEDANKDYGDARYSLFELGTDQIGISGFGFLQRQGVGNKDLPVTEIKKLRMVTNQTEFFKTYQRSSSCTLPNTIRVGTNCTSCNGGCKQYKYGGSPNLILDKYVTAVLVSEWESSWGSKTGGMNSLYAGAIAIRTMGVYFINHPVNSSLYDIGGDNCWQTFNINYFSNIMQNSNYYPNPGSAVSYTNGWILRENGGFPKSEYALETNNLSSCSKISCGDGHFQHSNSGYSGGCYPSYGIDYVSLGKSYCATGSHPRAMSQRGSMRWASELEVNNDNSTGSKILPFTYQCTTYCKKTWQQILGHYYSYYKLDKCSTGESIDLSSLSQVCGIPQPNLTEGGSSRIPNGRNINITAKVKNDGNGNAGPAFTTKFVVSYDTYLGNDYPLVDLNYNMTLLPCGLHSYTFSWKIPSYIPAGTYYLLETIDYGNKINESKENDNSFYFAGSFYVPNSLTGNGKEESTVNYINIDEMSIDKISNIDSRIIESQTIPVPNSFVSINECDLRIQNRELLFSNTYEGDKLSILDIIGHEIFNSKIENGYMPVEISKSGIYLAIIKGQSGIKCFKKIFITE